MLEIKTAVTHIKHGYFNGKKFISCERYRFIRDEQYFHFPEDRGYLLSKMQKCRLVPNCETNKFPDIFLFGTEVTPDRYVTQLKHELNSIKNTSATQRHRSAIVGKKVFTMARYNGGGNGYRVQTRVEGQYSPVHTLRSKGPEKMARYYAEKVNELTQDFIITEKIYQNE